jgi:hypothetical protein
MRSQGREWRALKRRSDSKRAGQSKRTNPFEEGLAFVLTDRKHTYENHQYTNNDGLAKI